MNCNDSDFDETSLSVPNRRNEITDMWLALASQKNSVLALRIAQPCQTWHQRLHLAHEGHRKVEEEFLQFCNSEILYHRQKL